MLCFVGVAGVVSYAWAVHFPAAFLPTVGQLQSPDACVHVVEGTKIQKQKEPPIQPKQKEPPIQPRDRKSPPYNLGTERALRTT